MHEPPPTGSLASRVASLFEKVKSVVGERTAAKKDGKIHLVGHSTGGVDIRLLSNFSYQWPGVDTVLREQFVTDYVGSIVTISAPLYGTPIARNLFGLFGLLVDFLSIWNILDQDVTRRQGPTLPAASATVLRLFGRWLSCNGPLLAFLAGMDDDTAREVALFRNRILSDTRCIRDLTPESMRALNVFLAGHDHPNLKHVVTVAPPPRLAAFGDPLRSSIYALCYLATADEGFEPSDTPASHWFDERENLVGSCPTANDGVVPATSQYLRPSPPSSSFNPVYVVLADHLDIVGHFEGKDNTTPFKSGAEFDRYHYEAVWKQIASLMIPPSVTVPSICAGTGALWPIFSMP